MTDEQIAAFIFEIYDLLRPDAALRARFQESCNRSWAALCDPDATRAANRLVLDPARVDAAPDVVGELILFSVSLGRSSALVGDRVRVDRAGWVM